MMDAAARAWRPLAAALVMLSLIVGLAPGIARADVFRPAYLELREREQGHYDVLWKVPVQGENLRLALAVRFPEGTTDVTPMRRVFTGDAVIERRQVRRDGGLTGEFVRLEGRAAGVADVIVRIERRDGTSQTERLGADQTQFKVMAAAGTGEVAWSYLVLGVEHILGGVDHLLFVLALLLIVHGGARIVATVTAFTVAHSLTLAGATLGWVRVPGPPVEACIALSIVFVAAEAVESLRGRPGLTARAPWLVAFTFGLLHGFGFAGALAEVGLPQKAIPVALLTFNVGVEVGQLLFVTAILGGIALAKRAALRPPVWSALVLPYAIGAVAMFWVVERVGAF